MRRLSAALVLLVLAGGLGFSGPATGDHALRDELVPVLPRDAIPAILAPTFDTDGRDWLPDDGPVIGVAIGGDVRAYPIAILNWHEIVNDVVGGVPVAVTFCPLCGTGIVFDRVVGSEALTFGVSGKLYKNDLVMYDHQTESYWTQILGEGIMGPHHGIRLGLFSSTTMSWGEWRALHPDTKLLDRPRDSSGQFLRNYLYNPYAGYETSSAVYFKQGNVDPYRVLHPKELVLGVFLNGEPRAYPISVLRDRPVVNDILGGVPILVTHANGVMKAWDRGNRTFVASGETAVADDLSKVYDRITGVGPDGALAEVPATTAFWFAWFDFFPATSIYGVEDLTPQADTPSTVVLASAGVGAAVAVAASLFVWRRRRLLAARARARRNGSNTEGRK